MTDTGDMSVTRTRICRTCQDRFTPFLVTDALCRPCVGAAHDREAVVRHLREVRFTTVADVAVATGVAATVIQQLVDDGTVEATTNDRPVCSCPPGLPGRCPICRRRLADELRLMGAPVNVPATVPSGASERRRRGRRARRSL